jgi:hypothetical protein
MPTNSNHDRDANPGNSVDREPKAGNTRQLLRALHQQGVPAHDRLYDEICRKNPGRPYDPSELVECSVKLSPRGFSKRRHGGSISWTPAERGLFAEAAGRAAPSDELQRLLGSPGPDSTAGTAGTAAPARAPDARLDALQQWVTRSGRFFSAIAYDFDAKLYKLYLFKARPVAFFEELDLLARRQELPSLAYIRSAEVPIDEPAKWKEALYFKLRFMAPPAADLAATNSGIAVPRKLLEILAPDFQPHRLLTPRLLAAVDKRDRVTAGLTSLLSNLHIVNDPIVKLTPPTVDEGTATEDRLRQAWQDLDYGVNVNLLDPDHIRFVQEHEAPLLQIADALGCQSQAKDWLNEIDPFDCFLSYVGIGPDSVSLYYRSTTLHRRQAARHFRRGGRRPRPG